MNQYNYNISLDCGVPIYQQVVDAITADIKSQKISNGTKLATVRQLSDQLQVARGTVKRAYDELEKNGVVEMIQGRGTFVRYEQQSEESRKEGAMSAIDDMLNTMERLGFTAVETNIFLELKLRERAMRRRAVRIALVECSPEILLQAAAQIQAIGNIDVFQYDLQDVLAYPYKISDEMDLIVTTAVHAKSLEDVVSDKSKVVKIALGMTPQTAIQVATLKEGERVGALCQSKRMGDLLTRIFEEYAPHIKAHRSEQMGQPLASVKAFLSRCDTLFVPAGYERYCDGETAALLQEFEKKHKLARCEYRIDEGSFLYLEERVQALQQEKED